MIRKILMFFGLLGPKISGQDIWEKVCEEYPNPYPEGSIEWKIAQNYREQFYLLEAQIIRLGG